jgi:hypothetical protein
VPESRLDRMLAPWIFVLTGIVFNILSALIRHYFIGVNNDAVNSTHFETLELQESRMPLESDNSRLFSIAIFLQVIGLILVLARDLRRI